MKKQRHMLSVGVALLVGGFLGVLFFHESVLSVRAETCDAGYLAGWAWTDSVGWISLSCQSEQEAGGSPTINYGLKINRLPDAQGYRKISGWAWNDMVGWICFGETCTDQTPSSFYNPAFGNDSYARVTREGLVEGVAEVLSLGPVEGWINLRGMAVNGDAYGVRLGQDGLLQDYAWNGSTEGGGTVGLGWIQFNPPFGNPWFKTKYGDIYSGGSVDAINPPPAGLYNATYCILANGTIGQNVVTENKNVSGGSCADSASGVLAFPDPVTGLATIGSIDWKGLYAGQYGKVVRPLDDNDLVSKLNQPLAGQVFRMAGNVTINSPITIPALSGSRGNGTVIVEGNLTINTNIIYSGDQFRRLPELPALGFLVRGDIIIDPTVSELAGAYVALGNSGRILTGVGANHLTISGLTMARHLSLQRTGSGGTAGSEEIIADGRLLANPPPGFTDLIKGLPSWQQVAP